MRLFSSRIKNVVSLSLLAVLVCTSCSQDSELDQSLEELENGDYQTLADMNMTRSSESDICVTGPIKEGSCIEIAFRKMINVGCIFIINPNMSKDLRLTATKILSIYFDHKKMWTGRIRRRLADTMGETQSGAFAWFIEDKDYQAKVLANFPTRKFDTFF